VAAGVALADEEGLEAVSIRKIAARLGSSPMALYHYVPSKSDLLNLILDAVNAECDWPATKFTCWRSTLKHYAEEMRRSLKRHPWSGILRGMDPEYGPNCIRIMELLLKTLSAFGLNVQIAMRSLGILFLFVNGFIVTESSTNLPARSGDDQPSRPIRFSDAVLATGEFPHVACLAQVGADLSVDEAFERALNWILDGIAADLANQSTSRVSGHASGQRRRTS
jgi:AcrR family transcriptional regulator